MQDLQDYARQIVPEYSVADLSDVLVHVFETISIPESIDLSINVKDAEKIRIDPTLIKGQLLIWLIMRFKLCLMVASWKFAARK